MSWKTSFRRRSTAVALVAVGLSIASQATAQSPFGADRSFFFYFENDAFGGNSDSSYTNGVRIGWEFAVHTPRLARLARLLSLEGAVAALTKRSIAPAKDKCPAFGSRTEARPCLTIGFGITQTMYTPSNIIDTTLQAGDRPYAGALFGSAIVTTLRHQFQNSTEFQLGVMGPWSSTESTQSLAHWTWSATSEKPRGWHHQIGNTLLVGVVNTHNLRAFEVCKPAFRDPNKRNQCTGTGSEERRFDITLRQELALATHITRASTGVVVRGGYRFPDAMTLTRIPTSGVPGPDEKERPFFWFAGFLTADMRHVAHNALITGNAVDDVPGHFGYERTITFRRNVAELSGGLMVNLGASMVAFQIVRRQKEYAPGGGWHQFGAITFSRFTPKG